MGINEEPLSAPKTAGTLFFYCFSFLLLTAGQNRKRRYAKTQSVKRVERDSEAAVEPLLLNIGRGLERKYGAISSQPSACPVDLYCLHMHKHTHTRTHHAAKSKGRVSLRVLGTFA